MITVGSTEAGFAHARIGVVIVVFDACAAILARVAVTPVLYRTHHHQEHQHQHHLLVKNMLNPDL